MPKAKDPPLLKITDNEAQAFILMLNAAYASKPNYAFQDRKAELKKLKMPMTKTTALIGKVRDHLNAGGVASTKGLDEEKAYVFTGDGGGGFRYSFPDGSEVVRDLGTLTTASARTGDKYDLLLAQRKEASKAKTEVAAEPEPAPAVVVAEPAPTEKKTKKKTKKKPAPPPTTSEDAPIYTKGLFAPDPDTGLPAWEEFFKEKSLEKVAPRLSETERKKLRKKYGPKVVTAETEFSLGTKSKDSAGKDRWTYDCTPTKFGDIHEGSEGWQGDAYSWFVKWSRGYCGWMSGATVHPDSPRQQLSKTGKVKKETPKQFQNAIGECRDMLWEMRDVLAPSACAYAMNNVIQTEKRARES
jgi:hypothetical protein